MESSYLDDLRSAAHWFTRMMSAAWRQRRERLEFAYFVGREPAEAGRVARELGLSTREMIKLSGKGGWSRSLLPRRMETLGLNFDSVASTRPDVGRDLAICCARCDSKLRCAYDLARTSQGDGWRDYCINRPTLDALRSES